MERRLVFTHVFKHPISVFSATPIVKRSKVCMTSDPETCVVLYNFTTRPCCSLPLKGIKNKDLKCWCLAPASWFTHFRNCVCWCLAPASSYKSKLFSFSRKSKIPITVIPSSFLLKGVFPPTIIIFLKESGILINEACSCSAFS